MTISSDIIRNQPRVNGSEFQPADMAILVAANNGGRKGQPSSAGDVSNGRTSLTMATAGHSLKASTPYSFFA